MASTRCEHCGVEEYMPYVCKFCKGKYCAAHRLPENHGCQGLGAFREKVRAEGRIMRSEPDVVQPSMSPTARAGMSLDAFWSRVDGKMTYVFLGIIVAVFLLEYAVLLAAGIGTFDALFVIDERWMTRPWTIVTSIFAHDPTQLNHIFFNSMALLFFGHTVERLIGSRRYTWLFLGAGAVGGIAQVILTQIVFNVDAGGLGASGALMGVMGTLVVLAPRLTVLVFFVVPAPLWSLAIFYVLFDLVGVITPGSSIGHFAHLTGLAVGLAYGYSLRAKGLRVVQRPREPQTPWR